MRCPLLDHRVVELAWSLPLDEDPGRQARAAEPVLDRHVPRALIERPKQGFGVPIGAWLRGPLRDWAETLLDERRLAAEGFLDAAAVRALWDAAPVRPARPAGLLWSVLMFQAWHEHWRDVPRLEAAPEALVAAQR